MSTAPLAEGCRNATREPRRPIRGVSSISRTPSCAQLRQRRLDVRDLIGDVVQPGPALREEPPDRRVGRERPQQLDVVLADVEQHRLDALLGHELAMHDRHPVDPLVQRERRVEVRDGDADVVDPIEQVGDGRGRSPVKPGAPRSKVRSVRVALIANRAAGSGLDPEPLVRAMRAHGADVEVFGCEAGDLERAAADAPERLVVAGGDGTVAGVAELAGRLDVPLGVIPGGTANDFVRAAGLPLDPVEAAALAVSGRSLRRLDLGHLADGRPFVNVASAGLASVAARRAAPLKPRLGPLAYAVGALRAAATAAPLPCAVRTAGATVFEGEAWQVIVAVTGAFGGGSEVGAADPQDGALDVTILPAGSRVGLARRAWGLKRGTIAEQRGVEHHRGMEIDVDLPPGTEFNADGEVRDRGMERITVERSAYALVVG